MTDFNDKTIDELFELIIDMANDGQNRDVSDRDGWMQYDLRQISQAINTIQEKIDEYQEERVR